MIYIPDFIYPKDEKGQSLCPRCRSLIKDCNCPSTEPAKPKQAQVVPKIRLDKSGRKGKIVTLIGSLPPSESYLKDLAKQLKTKTGSGGTFYIEDNLGIIEIQGDHKKTIEQYFEKLK